MKSTEIFNSTRDTNGQFKTGYRATIGTRYIKIEYLTNRQGDRDKRWRVPIRWFDTIPGETIDKVLYVTQNTEPYWVGSKIQ